ncbi:SpaA isopeptide-forming pilin-related protein, partial [Clostridium nigeriense]|uniref:SpaA isopeptide-forming pilin-related protein n=1 Tax=Clostridium nigeriense TaxID=1805470 RepID=UPI003D343C53
MKKVISYLLLITIIFTTLSNYQQKYVDASVNNSYEAYAKNTSEGMVYYIKDNGSSKVVYCFNHDKAQPPMLDSGTKLPQYTKLDYLISDDSSTVSSGVKKQIAAVLYAGYPNNAIGLQEKYGLSDDKARYYTQDALWCLIRGDTWFGGQVYDYWSALMEYGLSNQYYGDGTINFNGEFKLINDGQIWKTNIISVEGTYKESIIFENLPEGMKIIDADTNKEIVNGLKVGEKFYLTYTGNEINKSPFNIKYKYQNINIDFYKLISGTSEKDYQNLIGLNKKDAYKDISIEADKIDTSISISVNKVWEDDNSTTRPREVEVQLYKDGQAYGNIVKLNDANSWKHQWSNLDSTYEWTVDEVNTPAGYIKSVTNNDTNFTITNKKIVGKLEITKTDVSDGKLLPNAGFRIYDENKNVIAEGRTDEKGLATFELGYGKYYYQEFDAPKGYVIDEKLYPFEIKTNGEVVKASMT